jgi:4-hydroxybenzoate polyprenyltransferase
MSVVSKYTPLNAPSPRPLPVARLGRIPILVVVAMRPRQWLKNLFVLAPVFFTGAAGNLHLLGKEVVAALCFCGLSGGIYLLNDLCDRRRDALHPVKRRRPIASGALPVPVAAAAALLLLGSCLLWAALLSPAFLVVAAAYVVLMFGYSMGLKNVVLADVLGIAAGFVLRAIGGGVVIDVPISQWLFVCTALVTVFMGLGKRRHELSQLGGAAAGHRPVLHKYNEALLDQLISITTTATLVSYLMYCILSDTGAKHGGLLLTAPFVAYGLFRYLYCIYRKGKGGSPDEVLFKDKVFLGTGLAYGVAIVLALYFA